MTDKPLPPYLSSRIAKAGILYFWHVPKGRRPEIKTRHMPLGTDRDAAIAVAEAILRESGVWIASVKQRVIDRTALARQFAELDALSRTRALTNAESVRLEKTMSALGMK